MSSGFESQRAQILVDLGLQGEGVISTATEEMRQLREALAEVGRQNEAGILVGDRYLAMVRQIISLMNQLTRDVKATGAAFEITDAQLQQHLKTMQRAADLEDARAAATTRASRTDLEASQAAAELANVRQHLGQRDVQATQEAHDARVQAWQDQQRIIAAEEAAETDMAAVRAQLGKQETTQVQAEHDARVQAWQDEAVQRARIDQEEADRAKEILNQRQVAARLDAEVNKVIYAQARADESELTRTIEIQVNPRMAAHDRYRQSVNDAVQATQRQRDAENELIQAQTRHATATKQLDDALKFGGTDAATFLDLTNKQVAAESELIGAQLKHAASQDQVTDAMKSAATAQQAIQRGTQAGADSTMAWTRTIYFAAQGIEDLQYGFNAVVNNIPMVTMSLAQGLGASAQAAMGWGAAISLIAVGVNSVLIPAFNRFIETHEPVKIFFEDLNKQLNPFHVDAYATSLEKVENRIKELESKKIKVAVDMVELERLREEAEKTKKATEELNAILHKQTASEMQMGKNIATDVETEAGRKSLDDAVKTSVNRAIENSQKAQGKQSQISQAEAERQRYQNIIDAGAGDQSTFMLLEAANKRIEFLKGELGVINSTVSPTTSAGSSAVA